MDITLYLNKNAIFFRRIQSKNELDKLSGEELKQIKGFLIDSDEKEIRKIAETLKGRKENKLIAILGKEDEFNRRIIETCKIDFLVLNHKNKKDTLKQRDSGINHVVAKEAVKRKISFIINLSELEEIDKKERAKIVARIMQNIVICRKTKATIKIASFAKKEEDIKDDYQLKSILFSLGASSEQAANAIFSN